MLDLLAEMLGITDALEQRGIAYAVCGGMALAVHGFLRATDDIRRLSEVGRDEGPHADQPG